MSGPPAEAPGGGSVAWSPAQRRTLLVALTCVCGYLLYRVGTERTVISDPQPVRPLREQELADRIDPNTATAAELATLPGLGERRAGDIVRFRENHALARPGRPAFSSPQDLMKVRGIGVVLSQQMQPYLIFPPPTTGPATRP